MDIIATFAGLGIISKSVNVKGLTSQGKEGLKKFLTSLQKGNKESKEGVLKGVRQAIGKTDDEMMRVLNKYSDDEVSDLLSSSRKLENAVELSKLKNGHLAGKNHPKTGVPFKSTGFPDFSNYLYNGGKSDVKISPTGVRRNDFSAANKAAGYKKTPSGYTWHHHEDYGRMQLVEMNIHRNTGHTGGMSLWNLND